MASRFCGGGEPFLKAKWALVGQDQSPAQVADSVTSSNVQPELLEGRRCFVAEVPVGSQVRARDRGISVLGFAIVFLFMQWSPVLLGSVRRFI